MNEEGTEAAAVTTTNDVGNGGDLGSRNEMDLGLALCARLTRMTSLGPCRSGAFVRVHSRKSFVDRATIRLEKFGVKDTHCFCCTGINRQNDRAAAVYPYHRLNKRRLAIHHQMAHEKALVAPSLCDESDFVYALASTSSRISGSISDASSIDPTRR